jgi:hypothetical protein
MMVLMQQFVVLCGLASALDAEQPMSLNQVLEEFDSMEGLWLRVTNVSAMGSPYPESVTVWRSDLPLALYSLPGYIPADAAGMIFNRGKVQTLCAYPVNALTLGRKKDGKRYSCGFTPARTTPFGIVDLEKMSGPCGPEMSAESFVSAYLNKPQIQVGRVQGEGENLTIVNTSMWALEMSVCSFANVSVMLDAQKMLLNQSTVAPVGTTAEEWLRNSSSPGSLTAFNEVVIEPTDESAAAGIFWAHAGPFREPLSTDMQACQIAEYLKSDAATSPIFELAGVNLESPFQGCGNDKGPFSVPRDDCLSHGVAEWNANLTSGGGRFDASSVFRALNGATFLELECHGVQAAGLVV